jgi:hypothetical protein
MPPGRGGARSRSPRDIQLWGREFEPRSPNKIKDLTEKLPYTGPSPKQNMALRTVRECRPWNAIGPGRWLGGGLIYLAVVIFVRMVLPIHEAGAALGDRLRIPMGIALASQKIHTG